MPRFLTNWRFLKYVKLTHRFIRDTFNKDPKEPKCVGSPWLYIAIGIAARFTHAKIDPYEYDRKKDH